MCDYLKNNDISIKNGMDVNFVIHYIMYVLLEEVLGEERTFQVLCKLKKLV